ncbi:Histone-lysine N-methyltransferase ASHR3 [Glycine max]|nr:Histone-lysine N-methyltransferase ASHR3 [Glycine max]
MCTSSEVCKWSFPTNLWISSDFHLNLAQKEGHCRTLLESPTGTAKSLSLLCSSLAWQHHYKSQQHHLKPVSEATTDPLAHGGRFVPEEVSLSSEIPDHTQTEFNNKKKMKKEAPTIYYASRKHSQISQVVRELRKTTYRVPMDVLGVNVRLFVSSDELGVVCFICKKKQFRCVRCKVAFHSKCSPWSDSMLQLKDHHGHTEVFCRLPLPFISEEFKIDFTWKDMDSKWSSHDYRYT